MTWFNRLRSWVTDANNGIGIRPDYHDSEDNNFATGINNCLNIAGQNSPTSNINWNNFKITSLANGVAATDAANLSQIQSGAVTWCGTSTGSSNAYVLTTTPAIGSYAAGQTFRFIANFTNSGSATVNIDSLGAVNITKNGTTLLVGSEILINAVVTIAYDGSEFQITSVQIPLPLNAKGDLLTYYSAADQRFPVGADNTILTAASSQSSGLVWGSGPLTTKGDVMCFDTGIQRLPIGTNGQALTAQSAQTTGLQWATQPPLGSSYVTVGSDATLTANRVLTAGNGITLTDGGAGSTMTIAGNSWVKISSTTASSSASVSFTNLSATYRVYMVVLYNLLPGTTATDLYLRTSANNGSSYDSGASNYNVEYIGSANGSWGGGGTTADTQIKISANGATYQQTTAAPSSLNGFVYIHNPSASSRCWVTADIMFFNTSNSFFARGLSGGYRDSAAAVNAIEFLMSSGNIASGTFTLYGLLA